MKNIRKQQGFTLVELAIVLVIIGLIVSSVLVGQDLIRSAELRATTKQYQEYQVAVNTFINKFGQIPGDVDGDQFGLTGDCDGGAGTGDQNGLITSNGSATAVTTHDGEIACFWSNLTSSITGYIPGTFDGDEPAANVIGENLPQMKLGTRGWGVYGVSGVNYFTTGVVTAALNAYDTEVVFVPIDAFNIDDKIDDGQPATGNVVAQGAGSGTPVEDPTELDGTVPAAGTGECIFLDLSGTETFAAGDGDYNTVVPSAACNLRLKMVTF